MSKEALVLGTEDLRMAQFGRKSRRIGFLMALVAPILTNCMEYPPHADLAQTQDADPQGESPTLCAAIRGNGNLIAAHFGALARILEDQGEIHAMAGGSSGSISAFFYESMLLNPALPKHGHDESERYNDPNDDNPPSRGLSKRHATLALMMKSLLGFALVVGDSPEGHALQTLASVGHKVRAEGLKSLLQVNWWRAARKLHSILSDPEVRELINPTVLDTLLMRDRTRLGDYRFKVEELVKAFSVIGGFEPNDPRMFFREPALNYEGFTRALGRVANFYAGTDLTSNTLLETFLEACLEKSHGRTWGQIAASSAGLETCGSLFAKAVNTYRSRWRSGILAKDRSQNRLDHALGQFLPVFAPSAILQGTSAVNIFVQSLANYRNKKDVSLPVNFDDVRFGYFSPYPQGKDAFLAMKKKFSENAKIVKAVELNPKAPITWGEALRYSTMEPGISRIVQSGDDRAFIGGWADLHPTQILRAAGCKKIIYVNRIGAETTFIAKQHDYGNLPKEERHGVAEWLNMTTQQYWSLYDMRNPDNAYNQSIKEADAVWCTDWDSAMPTELSYMFDHSYGITPSARGPHVGHQSGMTIRSAELEPLFLRNGVPHIKTPLWGCH